MTFIYNIKSVLLIMIRIFGKIRLKLIELFRGWVDLRLNFVISKHGEGGRKVVWSHFNIYFKVIVHM